MESAAQTVNSGVGLCVEAEPTTTRRSRRAGPASTKRAGVVASVGMGWLRVPLIGTTLVLVVLSCQLRWSLASSLPWQCDELPLLVRFTGMCGNATNEAQALAFTPSLYSFQQGALRSVKIPNHYVSLHTTTGFWTNLGLHVFGYGTTSGRAGSLIWSMVAVLAAAWAGWLATRNVSGTCLSALFVSLAPMTIAYGAQSRGYSEAMALTLLLLIGLEYVRRSPSSMFRAATVLIVAAQLSLTVYTMWVYFVLPGMAVSVWLLPRGIVDLRDRRSARCVLGVILAALILVMTLYTAERWTQLSLSATSSFGERVDSASALVSLLSRGLHQAMPLVWIGIPLTIIGLFVVKRSVIHWWVWPLGLSLLLSVLFAAANGSPGYIRNFAFWVGPIAVLAACGGDALVQWMSVRAKPSVVYFLFAITVACGGGFAFAGLEERTRNILLPDWGALVQTMNAEPEAHGPRFLCPGLANHWQVEWYDATSQTERLLEVPQGGTIEVIFGSQYNEAGRLVTYRRSSDANNIPERDLPDFLSEIVPTTVRWGIEVRRFVGREITTAAFEQLSSDSPVFIVGTLASKPSAMQWSALLRSSDPIDLGLVEFAVQPSSIGLVQTLIAPASMTPILRRELPQKLGVIPESIRFYELSRLP